MPSNLTHAIDYAPKPARPCQCAEPFGDPRDGTCCRCGRQVDGKLLSGGAVAFPSLLDARRPARKRPRYRSAP